MGKCVICKVVAVLAAIGAVNWGLVGVANFNLVEAVFGMGSTITRIVYGLVGLSGLGILFAVLVKPCPCCKS